MSGLFGGGSSEPAPKKSDAAVQAEKNAEVARRRKARGRGATILTSGQGAGDEVETASKVLGGA